MYLSLTVSEKTNILILTKIYAGSSVPTVVLFYYFDR